MTIKSEIVTFVKRNPVAAGSVWELTTRPSATAPNLVSRFNKHQVDHLIRTIETTPEMELVHVKAKGA